ncbi:DUF5988 family protein [Paractinoplanes brasiliensis]|uniref:Uncharacterized protein n=1 Tax=Paractinoplanes brasiliensis TaxID=52695 RepID=A0A4R6JCA9_9ACTN|nr:DUF5988 family protein [Actinoplanes brasiliensis]TDO33192.1 hypothetical protein C8E87_8679 [Actinoplanes brasiliensis]GID33231.1 hypothetical protein Abr02nite_82140 [Actinoplanes brasiliensis]
MSSLAEQPHPLVDDREKLIEVVLDGGPAGLPAELRTHRIPAGQEKVKVSYCGGYEHFERPEAETPAGPVTYYWTGRTRVAE